MGVVEVFDCKSRTGLRAAGDNRIDAPPPGAGSLVTFPGSGLAWPEPNNGSKDIRWFAYDDAETCPAPAGE